MRLFEISAPKFYHGTQHGEQILRDGVLRPVESNAKASGNMKPMKNRIYFADLPYALMYAAGGDVLGRRDTSDLQGYGYVFVIDKREINNRIPDEDVVGEITAYLLNGQNTYNFDENNIEELKNLVSRAFRYIDSDDEDEYNDMTPYERFLDHEYEFYAAVGKYVLDNASRRLIARFASNSKQFSGTGEIKYSEAWKFKLSDVSRMNQDGSNFFDIATRVK